MSIEAVNKGERMKKYIIILLVALFITTLVGCKSNNKTTNDNSIPVSSSIAQPDPERNKKDSNISNNGAKDDANGDNSSRLSDSAGMADYGE